MCNVGLAVRFKLPRRPSMSQPDIPEEDKVGKRRALKRIFNYYMPDDLSLDEIKLAEIQIFDNRFTCETDPNPFLVCTRPQHNFSLRLTSVTTKVYLTSVLWKW